MDDKRTPMEAEVQELPNQREISCPEDHYGTAVKPKTRRSYVGFWIWMGIAVIAVCTVCVAAAVKHVRVENGDNGWRLAVQNTDSTASTEDAVRNLDVPEGTQAVSPTEPISDDVILPVSATAGEALSSTELYESVASSVVCVEVSGYYGSETYTGVVITADGCILSATDGLNGAVSITVSFPDGSALSARRLGEDSISGVCLLKVEAEGLKTVRFSGDTKPRVGQTIYSIGNPYGSLLPNVFSEGMISLERSVEIGGASWRLIQSTAFSDSPEYGRPILDEQGLVIGITTPIGRRLVSGTDPCFAIAAEDLARILSGFDRSASDNDLWLGLEVSDIPEEYHDFYRFPGNVWIESVSAGSASDGVLYQYDIITAIDGVELTSSYELANILAEHQAGDRVLLTIYRSGRFYNILLPVINR